MRMLVFGGTRFLSRAVAIEALARGHEVLCAARGESGPVPDGAMFVRIDRDAPDGLGPLRDTLRPGQRFDAVLDTARMSLRWVRHAVDEVGVVAGHWTFVSTINVYADTRTPGQTVDAALVAPWSGPKSLPLWLPPADHGLVTHDVAAALRAGLRQRPLADTAAAALAHERILGVDRPRQAGLTAAEETELLEAWQSVTRR